MNSTSPGSLGIPILLALGALRREQKSKEVLGSNTSLNHLGSKNTQTVNSTGVRSGIPSPETLRFNKQFQRKTIVRISTTGLESQHIHLAPLPKVLAKGKHFESEIHI